MEIKVPSTLLIRYIYLDIVRFSRRTIEDQVYLVSALNKIVLETIESKMPDKQVSYVPIGDGILIALYNPNIEYDLPITISSDLIRRIDAIHNPKVSKELKFGIRIGINQNIDNIIYDINGQINVCGSGVNYAQRIMNVADENQILVGQSIWENLKDRTKYRDKFRSFQTIIKHDIPLNVYQFIGSTIGAFGMHPVRTGLRNKI